jgi:ribbon-helix-helix protein
VSVWKKPFAGASRSQSRPTSLSALSWARRAPKKGDLSKFIEEAVRCHVFNLTVQDIRERNADADPEELQRIIDQAVREVRTERYAKKTAGKR